VGVEKLRNGTFWRDGVQVTSRRKETGIKVPDVEPSLVAKHEAAHALIALITGTASVKSADIIPNGPIQGTTYLSNFSLLVAAAGAGLGDRNGAGGDHYIATELNDVSEAAWNTAVQEAAQIINANYGLLMKLARAIQGWGSVDGGSLTNIFKEAKEGDRFVFTITAANGNAREVESRAESGVKEISVPKEVYDIIEEIAEKKREEDRKNARDNVVPFRDMLTAREILRSNDFLFTNDRSYGPNAHHSANDN
jgi:hypothetical protein